jgi:hypothetical protein
VGTDYLLLKALPEVGKRKVLSEILLAPGKERGISVLIFAK